MNHVRVNLFERGELEIPGAECGLELAAIFEDRFAGVPFHESEIENAFGFELAEAAGAGAETVNEPGEFAEGIKFEDLQALGFAKTPGSAEDWARQRGRLANARGSADSRGGGQRFPCGHDATSIIGAMLGVETGLAGPSDLRVSRMPALPR